MTEFGGKDKLLASLMQPKESPRGPLIQDLSNPTIEEEVIEIIPGVATDISEAVPSFNKNREVGANSVDEGPTMMEMMLAAQAEAAKSVNEEKKKEEKKASKGFGAGFKGGFLNSKKSSTSKGSKNTAGKDIPTIKASDPYETQRKGLAGKSETISQVQKEVQKAMEEQQDPMIKELEKGEWMTPELVKQFSENRVISQGLTDPRCTDAMQLMQKNPGEAKKKYGGDPKVDLFLREFGKVMSGHFDKLGKEQGGESSKNAPIVNSNVLVESKITKLKSGGGMKEGVSGLGPLAEQAVKRQQNMKKNNSSVEEEKRVKDVIANPELTKLLMDPNMQKILQECSTPALFRNHMRNPVTAKKIKLLFDAGLVGTAK